MFSVCSHLGGEVPQSWPGGTPVLAGGDTPVLGGGGGVTPFLAWGGLTQSWGQVMLRLRCGISSPGLSPGQGVHLSWLGGIPQPWVGGGYPSPGSGGYPSPGWGGLPQSWKWGLPQSWVGGGLPQSWGQVILRLRCGISSPGLSPGQGVHLSWLGGIPQPWVGGVTPVLGGGGYPSPGVRLCSGYAAGFPVLASVLARGYTCLGWGGDTPVLGTGGVTPVLEGGGYPSPGWGGLPQSWGQVMLRLRCGRYASCGFTQEDFLVSSKTEKRNCSELRKIGPSVI